LAVVEVVPMARLEVPAPIAVLAAAASTARATALPTVVASVMSSMSWVWFTSALVGSEAPPAMYGRAVHVAVPSPNFILVVSVSTPNSPAARMGFWVVHVAAVPRRIWMMVIVFLSPLRASAVDYCYGW
jgi:hypothetical protein